MILSSAKSVLGIKGEALIKMMREPFELGIGASGTVTECWAETNVAVGSSRQGFCLGSEEEGSPMQLTCNSEMERSRCIKEDSAGMRRRLWWEERT